MGERANGRFIEDGNDGDDNSCDEVQEDFVRRLRFALLVLRWNGELPKNDGRYNTTMRSGSYICIEEVCKLAQPRIVPNQQNQRD